MITGFTAGTLSGANAGLSDYFVAKFSGADGSLVWLHQEGTAAWDEGTGVAVDPADNSVVVVGYTRGDLAGNSNSGG